MWQGIIGHDAVVERFRRTLARSRLASTYLFVGPSGIGKRQFALTLAKGLLCQQSGEGGLEPCGHCESCVLFASGNHPDLDLISLPPDKTTLPISLFLGDDQHRNQDGMCHRIALRPFLGGRKIAIIDDADHFSQESANCLLKTLEEPPPRSVVFLIGTSPSKQLPTIRSRSQVVRFQPLATEAVAEILLRDGTAGDHTQAARLASYSEGSVERARALADPTLWQFRELLLQALAAQPIDAVRLAKTFQAFVDDAGKEAELRRERLRTVVGFAVELYRGVLRPYDRGAATDDAMLASAVERVATTAGAASVERAIATLDTCLTTLEYVDRNANLALVIQKWCEDVAGLWSVSA